MRKHQRVRGEYSVAVENEIQIQGSRRVTITAALPAQGALDSLQRSFQFKRAQSVTHLDHAVHERWILRTVESGRSVEGRNTPHTDLSIEQPEPARHVFLGVDVRANRDKHPGHVFRS